MNKDSIYSVLIVNKRKRLIFHHMHELLDQPTSMIIIETSLCHLDRMRVTCDQELVYKLVKIHGSTFNPFRKYYKYMHQVSRNAHLVPNISARQTTVQAQMVAYREVDRSQSLLAKNTKILYSHAISSTQCFSSYLRNSLSSISVPPSK